MTTMVGKSDDVTKVIQGLVELEYDALAAYRAALDRFENAQYKAKFQEFIGDHEQHLSALKNFAQAMNIKIADGTDMKAILTKGKVVLADIMGDDAILSAMKTNEDDTVTAYQRASEFTNLAEDIRKAFEKGYMDEVRHRDWMMQTAEQSKNRAA